MQEVTSSDLRPFDGSVIEVLRVLHGPGELRVQVGHHLALDGMGHHIGQETPQLANMAASGLG